MLNNRCSPRKHLCSVKMSSEGNCKRQRQNAGEGRGCLRMAITDSKGERSKLNKGNVSNKLRQSGNQAAHVQQHRRQTERRGGVEVNKSP